MRLPLTILALSLFLASCAPTGSLCSDDPACEPSGGCGQSGCLGGSNPGGTGGSGGVGGQGGGGGGGGGGSGGADARPWCAEMCGNVYFTCATMLTGPNGAPISHQECMDGCEAGTPSRAQAACVAGSACLAWDMCLQPVPEQSCDLVCKKVYETCGNGALVVDGAIVDEISCRHACPEGLSNRQAACIANADCTQWVHCAP